MSNFTKLLITGKIHVKTGLHIGASGAFSAIGAVDSPVIRDPFTRQPIIPGSSLKGKMRYLLARARSDSPVLENPDKDKPEIVRLFGSPAKGEDGRLVNSRLKFSDCFLNKEKHKILKDSNIPVTEVKFENSINRQTAVANPRQIERVISGAEFDFELIYDVDKLDELEADFATLREGLTLLENDYLGGHGTRGSGRVEFKDLKVEFACGVPLNKDCLNKCNLTLENRNGKLQ